MYKTPAGWGFLGWKKNRLSPLQYKMYPIITLIINNGYWVILKKSGLFNRKEKEDARITQSPLRNPCVLRISAVKLNSN